MRKEQYHMTPNELQRIHVIQQCIDGILTNGETAHILGLSQRQVIRLKKGVRNEGPQSMLHQNRGRQPAHTIPQDIKDQLISLKSTPIYQSANFAHFTELVTCQGEISLSYATVYRILTKARIKSPKTHHRKTMHRTRKRKNAMGRLVQIDASPFSWIPGEASLALHGAIDDATGQVLGLCLFPTECLEGYFTLLDQVLTRYGLPIELYADRHTIFFSPKTKTLSLEEELAGKVAPLTQFGRALDELGISLIPAYSPQAKGRVERLWETLQSRIPVEIALHKITTLEEANHFLETHFLPHFNERFAHPPREPQTAFRPLPPELDLATILCWKAQRKSDAGGVFSYQGSWYQIDSKRAQTHVPPRSSVTVCERSGRGICILYQGTTYSVTPVQNPPASKPIPLPPRTKRTVPPAPTHPWKQGRKRHVGCDLSDREILENLLNSTLAWR